MLTRLGALTSDTDTAALMTMIDAVIIRLGESETRTNVFRLRSDSRPPDRDVTRCSA